jgi:phosphinothricin acetyltransferase
LTALPRPRVRLATRADAPRIIEIYSYYVLNTPVTFETEVPTLEDYEGRIDRITQFFPFFVVEEDGVVVGYAYGGWYNVRWGYRWVCESSIYVAATRRHAGLGTLLYGVLLRALRDQGMLEVYAILGPNEASERFHERLGFTKRAWFPAMGFKLGDWHHVVYYSRVLRERDGNEQPPEPVPFASLDPSAYVTPDA